MLLPMDISRSTPEQLIIEDTPWLLGIGILAVILTLAPFGVSLLLQGAWFGLLYTVVVCGVGMAVFAAFVRRVQLILDRPANTITLRTRSLFGMTQVQHDLHDLSGAILETTTGGKGTILYRPSLILDSGMSAGTHPIIASHQNSAAPKHIVDTINTWLDPAGASL